MKIDSLIEERWYLRPGASLEEVRRAETAMGASFPADYVELITWSNGGDFRLGERYLRLWPIEDVVPGNTQLDVHVYLPGMVAIGSDAGELLYLFDYSVDRTQPRLVEVEGDNMCSGEIVVHAASLTAAFCRWSGLDRARVALLTCLAARAHLYSGARR
jgi:hypothetical protein